MIDHQVGVQHYPNRVRFGNEILFRQSEVIKYCWVVL